jgi:phytoene desaturase
MARVAVIGAGMAGLAVSARLAKRKHDVTVLEASSTIGGKLGRYSRDGFVFDTGPSLLTIPAVYRDTFRKSGRPLERELDLVPVDPAFHYRFADGSDLRLPNASRARAKRALDDAFGDDAGAQWFALLERAGQIWDVTRGPFLESPLEGRRTLARLARNVDHVRIVAPWQTLRGMGRQYLRDPRLTQMLDRYATYSGSDPRKAPGVLSTIPYVEQTFGAWHVPGGLRNLGEALARRVEFRGATIRTGAEVTQVLVEDGRACGVRLADGETVTADVVIANCDASTLYGGLLAGDRATERSAASVMRSIDKAGLSFSGFVLLLAVRGRTPGMEHHTVLFPADYDDEFDSVFGTARRAARPAPDPAIYICNPDDPQMHPDGHESWFVLVNAPRQRDLAGPDDQPGTIEWTAPGVADTYADHVLAVMAKRGLDVRDRLLWRVVRTPADLARETGAPGGAIYGTSSNSQRAAFLRPANQSPIPGLYLVGGSSHPGGGLPLVGLSAEIVSDLIGDA